MTENFDVKTATTRQIAMRILAMASESQHEGCADSFGSQAEKLGLMPTKVRAFEVDEAGNPRVDEDGMLIPLGEDVTIQATEQDLNNFNYRYKDHDGAVLALEAFVALRDAWEEKNPTELYGWNESTDRAAIALLESGWNPGEPVDERFLESVKFENSTGEF